MKILQENLARELKSNLYYNFIGVTIGKVYKVLRVRYIMKIALVKQKTGYNLAPNTQKYFDKLRHIIAIAGAEIFVGPELAISNSSPISEGEFDSFNKGLQKLLNGKGIIIPGTALVNNNGFLKNIAPVIFKKNILYFNKKSSVMEDEIAEKKNLEYKTGEDNEGFFCYGGKDCALEICRDHGHGKLKYSTNKLVDIEFILSCNLGGFSPDKNVVKNFGIVVIADGNNSSTCAYEVKERILKEIKGEETKDYLLINC